MDLGGNKMTLEQRVQFLKDMKAAAIGAHHPWPGAAAAESAVETGWGQHVPKGSNNYLGIKAFHGWAGPTVSADGTEQSKDGVWSGPQHDLWCVFQSAEDCFAEQVVILHEPRYAAALEAPTVESYIVTESAIWSTGILRGSAVLQTFNAHRDILA